MLKRYVYGVVLMSALLTTNLWAAASSRVAPWEWYFDQGVDHFKHNRADSSLVCFNLALQHDLSYRKGA